MTNKLKNTQIKAEVESKNTNALRKRGYMRIFSIGKILLISLALLAQAEASTLYIKNDDSANVNIIIEPGEGSITPNSTEIKQVIKPGAEKTINVSKESMNNANSFSVKGKVTLPSIYNTCGPLLIDNNYKIIFVGGKAGGVVCTYQQID